MPKNTDSAMKQSNLIRVQSPLSTYSDNAINSTYKYTTTQVTEHDDGSVVCVPSTLDIQFELSTKVGRTGVMIVGLGGNNGSTFYSAVLANKENIEWRTKRGIQKANWYGSMAESSTMLIGSNGSKDVYAPLKKVVPLVDASQLIVGGWDISSKNLLESARTAGCLDVDLVNQIASNLEKVVPKPGIYIESFIAENQKDRADNVLVGNYRDMVDQLKADIKYFKSENSLDNVIILWSANTERYSEYCEDVHYKTADLLKAVKNNHPEIAPSVLYCIAAVESGCTFINGSPQNTFCPALETYARENKTFIAGDDFKTGQTKIKSVLVDWLVQSALKPQSIVSYNHLGNNDGRNLSSGAQFRSKEISKSGVVDDVISSNSILYKEGEHPDHCVVIKYVPYVGDSKRAMDEYTSEGLFGSANTIVLHNTCEDSMLAVPLMADLVIFSEFCQRLKIGMGEEKPKNVDSILSLLSLFLKAPISKDDTPVINCFFSQRSSLTNLFRVIVGLPVDDQLRLSDRT